MILNFMKKPFSEAKEKFDSYISAYSSGWMTERYKKLYEEKY